LADRHLWRVHRLHLMTKNNVGQMSVSPKGF
jgi:hypothetical protein